MNTSLRDPYGRWALLPLRAVIGFGFVSHGLAKLHRGPEKFAKLLDLVGTPLPLPTAWLVTSIEIVGGLAILAGAFVLIASLPLIGTMIGAMATVHWRYGFSAINTVGLSPSGPVFGPPGYEVNLLYIAALLALCVAGAGAVSVDGWRVRRRRPRSRADAPSETTTP